MKLWMRTEKSIKDIGLSWINKWSDKKHNIKLSDISYILATHYQL